MGLDGPAAPRTERPEFGGPSIIGIGIGVPPRPGRLARRHDSGSRGSVDSGRLSRVPPKPLDASHVETRTRSWAMPIARTKPGPPTDDKRWKIVETRMRRLGNRPRRADRGAALGAGSLRLPRRRRAALRRRQPGRAALDGLRRGDVLPLLHAQAAGRAHLRGVHRDGLLHQRRVRDPVGDPGRRWASSPSETTEDGKVSLLTARCLGRLQPRARGDRRRRGRGPGRRRRRSSTRLERAVTDRADARRPTELRPRRRERRRPSRPVRSAPRPTCARPSAACPPQSHDVLTGLGERVAQARHDRRRRSSGSAASACAPPGRSSRSPRPARCSATSGPTRLDRGRRRPGRRDARRAERVPSTAVLRAPGPDRDRELGPDRPGEPRRLRRGAAATTRCARRSPTMTPAEVRDEMTRERPARPRRRRLPDRAQVEHGRQGRRRRRSTSSATPTRATRARSWTAASSRATRTACSRAWPSRPTPSAPAQGYVYCRAEYPLAVEPAPQGHPARPAGPATSGASILDTEFSLRGRRPARRRRVRVRRGDRADRLDRGRARARRRPRPPYPAVAGLWGQPTLINNVETFANIAPIIRNGGDWFAGIGTEKSKGTKVFALAGRVVNTGLDRGADGHDAARDRLRHRRRHRRRRGRSRPSRPAARPAAASRPSSSTCRSTTSRCIERRLVHGLGRHDRHGRHVVHGRRRQVLHGLLPRGVVRQVRPLPRRHDPAVHAARPDHQRRGDDGRPGAAGAAVPRWSSGPACAASARAPRTRSSARCATSATSTSPTSRIGVCPAGVCTIEPAARCRHDRPHAHGSTAPTSPATRARRSSPWPPRTASTSRRMCHLDGLSDTGACRLCVVEVAGSNKLTPACATDRRRGHGGHDRLRAARSSTAGRSPRCCSSSATTSARSAWPTTTASSRTWPRTSGVDHFELPVINPTVGIDAIAPAASRIDHNRCIMCVRCVRVCGEIEGAHTWGVMGSRHRRAGRHRHGHAVGRVDDLHQLRQVRPGLPDRRAVREGPRRSPRGARSDGRSCRTSTRVGQERRRTMTQDRRLATDLARRLLRLPHVVPRHGRAAARDRRARRHRLQPAGRHQGVSRRTSTSASSRARSRQRGRPPQDQARSASTPRTLISFGDCAVTAQRARACATRSAPQPLLERAYLENVTLNPRHPDRGRAGAPADGPAGPSRRQGRRLPARLPAVGRPHLPVARRPARGPDARTPPAPASAAEGTTMTSTIVIDPVTRIEGHSKITIHLDERRRGDRRPVPRHPVPRLRADRPGPAGPRDALDHGAHLRHLPGQPPDRVGEGVRRDPGRRAAADRRRPAPGHEPGPDRPVERAELLPPVVAGPAVRLRRRPGQAQHHRRRARRTRSSPATASACASSASRSSSGSAASGSTRPGSCPAASTRR